MTRPLTKLTLILILINIIFAVSPISLYGYYSDTIFLILTFFVTTYTLVKRIRTKHDKLINIALACSLPIMAIFIYFDLDFHDWAPVRRGTVKEIERENQESDFFVTIVDYQLNSNNEVGPGERRVWVKKAIKYLPIVECTIVDGQYDHYEDIEELK